MIWQCIYDIIFRISLKLVLEENVRILRRVLAVWACKLLILLSKLSGHNGSSMPGQIALKIYPNLLSELASSVRKEIIVVCGTDGKTTTNNMLCDFLLSEGYSVVSNRIGANMLYGVCCAFANHANCFGKLDADYAAIEIDEASAVKVFDHFAPDKIIIINLFRDQLDRYGEIDITIDYLKRAIEKCPEAQLILNADDPLSAQFGYNSTHKCYYVGVDEDTGNSLNEIRDGQFCTICGGELSYEYYHYSQLGNYKCTKCDFKRPQLDLKVNRIFTVDGIIFDMTEGELVTPVQVTYRGFYNIYNIALSYYAAKLSMGKAPDVQKVLSAYKPQIGRMEEFIINNKKVILNLSKNPAGFNQAISTVVSDWKNKDVMIIINDNAQDGKDISWIWDVDFERLNVSQIKSFTLAGIRVDDLCVRAKYAHLPMENTQKEYSLQSGVKRAVSGNGEVCYILSNYTATFKTQDILKKLERS